MVTCNTRDQDPSFLPGESVTRLKFKSMYHLQMPGNGIKTPPPHFYCQ